MTPLFLFNSEMHILAIHTPVIKPGDDLAAILRAHSSLQDGDVVVVSSKAIATAEGSVIDLRSLIPSVAAADLAEKTKLSPAFVEAVLHETQRLNGEVRGYCPGAVLTELKPTGMKRGSIFAPHAGMDQSNMEQGFAAGWPHDPVTSAQHLKKNLGVNCAVIISDSCCRPRRIGVTAFALTVCGMDPLKSEVGKTDLYGRELRMTVESVADQFATAANAVMGNADQSIPAAIIRDHGYPLTEFLGWVDGISKEEDLFRDVL